MNIQEVKELKDKIYEIEGLLELAQLRPDKLDELAPLIETRLQALAATADAATHAATEVTQPKAAATEVAPQAATILSQTPDSTLTANLPEAKELAVSITAAEAPKDPKDPNDLKDLNDLKDPKDPKDLNAATAAVRERPVFCIGDRFRFSRELFGNSQTEFNATLDLVAAMKDYREAEDYFLNELGWDPAVQEVADFMDIIKLYFNE